MKNKFVWLGLSFLLVSTILLTSCGTKSNTTKTTSITTTTKTTTTAVNWWDSLGTPTYGGTMTLRRSQDFAIWDPYQGQAAGLMPAYMETLFADNWILKPTVFDYKIGYRPDDYIGGSLAESWEFTDPSTFVIHLRQGIHWQNIAPVSGREFTSDDVVYTYDRLFGLGDGFTTPAPYWATFGSFKNVTSLTATDRYTVVAKFNITNPLFIEESFEQISDDNCIEAREVVDKWGDLNDWHNAIGTGPFIMQNYESGSSATLVKNPNYWGHDERYPQNQLPYIDTLEYLVIPDQATALAALRTGKIDFLDNMSLPQAQAMQQSNPNIQQVAIPAAACRTLDPRNDVKPFNDIRVREAMQMAINLPEIAQSYYGGTTSPDPSTLTSNYMGGWGFPYSQWPQDLKDQYAYNPTAAMALLTAAGYPNGFDTDVVADNAGDMGILQIVKSYFAAININMTITSMDSVSWFNLVRVNKKFDQIACRADGALGLSFTPTMQLDFYLAGTPPNYYMANDPVYADLYTKAKAATTVDAFKQALADANKEVASQHFVISLLQPNTYAFVQPWLKGFTGQSCGISSTTGGVDLINFYGARYWIDTKLKNSQ